MRSYYLTSSLCLAMALAGCGGGGSRDNVAPQLGAIADTAVEANVTSDPISFSVSDRAVANVQVVATSGNQGVIPDAGIAITGSAGNLALTVTPAADVLGSSTITVTATDRGGLSDQVSFLVTVQAQMVSLSQYVRDTFADGPNEQPRDLNSRLFEDDAEANTFDDLVSP